jgi:hypothetical protein
MSRESRLDRPGPRRSARARLLVVLGSDRTERQYFAGLRDSLNNRAVDIQILGRPKSPVQVVEYASKQRGDFDEAWCVVDVDRFDIPAAIQAARRARVELVVSNPCFELWLLLHHEDHRAALTDCVATLRRLRRHLPRYDKARLDFADFAKTVPDAIARAKALDAAATGPLQNPSTSVWRLVEKIMG